MRATDVLLLVGAIVALLGIALGMTRWSRRKYDELRRVVSASDDAMRAAGRTLGLEFVPQRGYEHPLVGNVPAFGLVRGVLDGVPVEARVVSDLDAGFARTELTATLDAQGADSNATPDGLEPAPERYRLRREKRALTLVPRAEKSGSSQFIAYELVLDSTVLVSLVRELVELSRREQRE